MSALLPGYEYDIFISYRQNDNRSGWVTEFVKALQEELASTIKDSVSVYFDSNPHDGLLETHNVDKSLEGKLKCLIFIPILSQTYCDPKSFAWQFEFCAFNQMARADQFGSHVRLGNGNVSARILPIRIHDLEPSDTALLETELGAPLRAIDFVFSSRGVNRPLRASEEHPNDNLNKVYYLDQINKLSLAIKGLLSAIRNPEASKSPDLTNPATLARPSKKRAALATLALLTVTTIVIFLIPHKEERQTNSIAVLAFKDLSEKGDQEWYADGLSEEILNRLANLKQLKVTARTSSFYFKGKDTPIPEIAEKLGVENVVEGSLQHIGDNLRITVQLIRADGFHIWSKSFDRSAEDLFKVQSEIALNVATTLLNELSPESGQMLFDRRTTNQKAYESYLKGNHFHERFRNTISDEDFTKGVAFFEEALALDDQFGDAYGELANLYDTYGDYHYPGKLGAWAKRDSLSDMGYRLDPGSISILRVKSWRFQKAPHTNLDSAWFYIRQAHRLNQRDARVKDVLGVFYVTCGFGKESEKLLEELVSIDPLSPRHYVLLAESQFFSGKPELAHENLLKALAIDSLSVPANFGILRYCLSMKNFGELKSVERRMKKSGLSPRLTNMISGLLEGNTQEILKESDKVFLKYLVRFAFSTPASELIVGFDDMVAHENISSYELEHYEIYGPLRDLPEFRKTLEKRRVIDQERRAKYEILD